MNLHIREFSNYNVTNIGIRSLMLGSSNRRNNFEIKSLGNQVQFVQKTVSFIPFIYAPIAEVSRSLYLNFAIVDSR